MNYDNEDQEREDSYILLKQFAESIGVSERTIQQAINDCTYKLPIGAVVRRGKLGTYLRGDICKILAEHLNKTSVFEMYTNYGIVLRENEELKLRIKELENEIKNQKNSMDEYRLFKIFTDCLMISRNLPGRNDMNLLMFWKKISDYVEQTLVEETRIKSNFIAEEFNADTKSNNLTQLYHELFKK